MGNGRGNKKSGHASRLAQRIPLHTSPASVTFHQFDWRKLLILLNLLSNNSPIASGHKSLIHKESLTCV